MSSLLPAAPPGAVIYSYRDDLACEVVYVIRTPTMRPDLPGVELARLADRDVAVIPGEIEGIAVDWCAVREAHPELWP